MASTFEHLVRVRWRDTDAQGHVNHAVFLTYLEEGRDAFYAQVLGSDPSYVVVRLEVDLRAEVRHPDQQVTVRIQAESLGTTSLTTQETILTSAGDVAAEARVVTVRWDPSQRQPIPFSQAERTRLAAAMARLPLAGDSAPGGHLGRADGSPLGAPVLGLDHAGIEQLQPVEEARDRLPVAHGRPRAAHPLVHPPGHLRHPGRADVAGRVRQHQVAAGRQRARQLRHDAIRVVGVGDQVQDDQQHQRDWLAKVQGPRSSPQDRRRGAQIGFEVGGRAFGGC